MEFLVVMQKPGESPGLMEVYGFYDSEGQVANVVRVLKRDRVTFGVYQLYELEEGKCCPLVKAESLAAAPKPENGDA
jgi:hypothetical protein